jgi:uncharacterized protein (TIGR02466 family)
MNREYYFATPIYAEALKNASELNKSLEEHIVKWSAQEPGLKKTNRGGWHSTDMTKKKEYYTLMEEILRVCGNIFEEEKLIGKPVIGNMWANINYENAYNRVHLHANSLFSGTYYIKTPAQSGSLIVHDPRPGVHINMPKRKEGELPKQLWMRVFFQPRAGQMIIFPSWVWHEVEPHPSKDTRISVAFNIVSGT